MLVLIRRLPFYYGWVNLLIAALAMTAFAASAVARILSHYAL